MPHRSLGALRRTLLSSHVQVFVPSSWVNQFTFLELWSSRELSSVPVNLSLLISWQPQENIPFQTGYYRKEAMEHLET